MVAVVSFFFLFAFFGGEISLAPYLSSDVGSLICLLLLSLPPAEACRFSRLPAVVKTIEAGWKEGKRCGEGEDEAQIYVDTCVCKDSIQ